jgi:putative exporter of polyketide antibiotics
MKKQIKKFIVIFNWIALYIIFILSFLLAFCIYKLTEQRDINMILGEQYFQQLQDNKDMREMLENYENLKWRWNNSKEAKEMEKELKKNGLIKRRK